MGQMCSNDTSVRGDDGTARPLKNSAFVFIKPHAVTDKVQELVRAQLAKSGIIVKQSNRIAAEDIDKKGLIDKHYGAIASRAYLQQPTELVVQQSAKDEFKNLFGLAWEDALSSGQVFNAKGAAEKLGVEPLEISNKFDKLKRGENQIKFGGGFYVGKVDDIYVVNGFYTRMRAKFTTPGKCIQFFEVVWDPEELPWKKFRAEIIGATNPAEAAAGSIRRLIYEQWESLGLEAQPDTGDNSVHASASPFEGLAERANWLDLDIAQDAFGKAMIGAGVSKETIIQWSQDPPVEFEGKKQSLFDLLEDIDSSDCISKGLDIQKANK